MERIFNFSAGPAVLPERVLREAQAALWNLNGSGVGLLETSHRWDIFDEVIASAEARLRRLLALDDDQVILFMQGGAQTQFFMWPMNILRGGTAAYLDTGRWSTLAAKEAARFGTVLTPYSSKDTGYDRVCEPDEWGALPEDLAYLHYTSNNTVAGTEFHYVPQARCSLVCDMSSNILSRPIEASAYDFIYAGAQKNMGPSGVALAIIRQSVLERCDDSLPTMLRYGRHVQSGSRYNTPNTFGIFVIDRICAWIEDQGGLAGIGRKNAAQAERVYGAIDRSALWRGLVRPSSRSLMNLTFSSGDPALDTAFWTEGDRRGLRGLKGHKSVGGLRASLYNAQTDPAVDALIAYLDEFEAAHL